MIVFIVYVPRQNYRSMLIFKSLRSLSVLRLPPEQARWGYVMIALAANAWLIGAALTGALPALVLIALVAAIPSAQAAADLFRYAAQPRALTAAIRRTIAAALLHGLLLTIALFFLVYKA